MSDLLAGGSVDADGFVDPLDPGPRLRIALVADCYLPQVGGIEMQVHDLAVRLVGLGHQVTVITATPGPERIDGVDVLRLEEPLLPLGIPFTRATFAKLRTWLAGGRWDVVHFHSGVVSPLAFGGAFLSQSLGLPTLITSHCIWSQTDKVFGLLDRAVHWSRWPVVFSGVSDVAASEIRSVTNGTREVLVLHNGIDPDRWRVHPEPRTPGVVRLVSVMRLARRKRPDALVRMVAETRRRVAGRVDVQLDLIGDGPARARLERTIARGGLGDVVRLHGRLPREDIKAHFARADVFVAPAELESFGIAALEARCAGLPVVAKVGTGIREFVEHGREGLLARSDRDMVAQLVRLATDEHLRREIAVHNRTTVPAPVWPKVVEANLDAYRQARALARRSHLVPGRR